MLFKQMGRPCPRLQFYFHAPIPYLIPEITPPLGGGGYIVVTIFCVNKICYIRCVGMVTSELLFNRIIL